MNLVDTSGWLEYCFDEPNAAFFSDPIENIENLIVPVICIYEVYKKTMLVADESKALHVIAHMKQGKIIELTEEIAIQGAMISLNLKLPMADSFIYATGQITGSEIWTQDSDFKNLPGVHYIEKPAVSND